MDIQAVVVEAYGLLWRIQRPIRIPTARWLLSDYFDIIDLHANDVIEALLKLGKIKQTTGGWLEVNYRVD